MKVMHKRSYLFNDVLYIYYIYMRACARIELFNVTWWFSLEMLYKWDCLTKFIIFAYLFFTIIPVRVVACSEHKLLHLQHPRFVEQVYFCCRIYCIFWLSDYSITCPYLQLRDWYSVYKEIFTFQDTFNSIIITTRKSLKIFNVLMKE